MTEFLAAILAFPTVVFTVMLVFVVLYWVSVVLGALDIDLIDIGDGGLDADVGDIGDAGDVGDAGGDAGDVGEGGDAGDGGDGPTIASVVHAIGLGGVPLTVSLSFLILFAWFLSALGVNFLGSLIGGGLVGLLVGIVLTLLALVTSVAATSVAIRPLRKLFVTHGARRRRSLVGKVCTVTTLSVDASFGQAEVEDGGAGLLIQVRARDANDLTRGSRALIFDYDADNEAFIVTAAGDALDELSERFR